jgi:acetate---CoA ligase (ADP-forming)
MSLMPPRRVYRHADLVRLLAPESIALVGASPIPGSFGAQTLRNLAQYDGQIYLVNGKYDHIGERPCFASVSSLPAVPDCVLIAVPQAAVESVVIECAAAGAGGVVIYASGYAETGRDEQMAEQDRLARISRESGLRIIGPNCIGIINFLHGFGASFSRGIHMVRPRTAAIGLVSQSGAVGIALAQAVQHGTSISHMLASGNSVDVDVADCISYLAEDAACKAIACVFEGMPFPERLIEAGEIAATADKPLIVYKLARGEQGAAAAKSHTGLLAGSSAAYRAAFDRAGIVVVEQLESLVETAVFFAKAPRPQATGVAVAAVSGGLAIMAADEAEVHGVQLPQPGETACAMLRDSLPDFGAARNPCDVTGAVTGNPESFTTCVDALLSDPAYGAIVMPHHNASDSGIQRIKAIDDLAMRHGKMGCVVWGSGWLEGPGAVEAEQATRAALFRSMDRCFATLAAWHRRELRRAAGPRRLIRHAPKEATEKAARLLEDAKCATLTEREAKEVLSIYGVPVVSEELVDTAEAAVHVAMALGGPVALKVESQDLPHKTEAGVIRLDVRGEAEVRSGFEAILTNAKKSIPASRIKGVLVQPMISPGVEIMVGARMDPLFGPLILVGLGGIMVELLKDTAVALAPVTREEAMAMLCSLKGYSLLTGFRGMEPVDVNALASVICRLSEFAADQRERVLELDVNPLICSGGRITAVDALIVRAG